MQSSISGGNTAVTYSTEAQSCQHDYASSLCIRKAHSKPTVIIYLYNIMHFDRNPCANCYTAHLCTCVGHNVQCTVARDAQYTSRPTHYDTPGSMPPCYTCMLPVGAKIERPQGLLPVLFQSLKKQTEANTSFEFRDFFSARTYLNTNQLPRRKTKTNFGYRCFSVFSNGNR